MSRVFTCLCTDHLIQGNLQLYVARYRQAAEFLLTKDNFENSWAPNQGFETPSSVQQAGILPLDQSNALFIQMNIGATARAIFFARRQKENFASIQFVPHIRPVWALSMIQNRIKKN